MQLIQGFTCFDLTQPTFRQIKHLGLTLIKKTESDIGIVCSISRALGAANQKSKALDHPLKCLFCTFLCLTLCLTTQSSLTYMTTNCSNIGERLQYIDIRFHCCCLTFTRLDLAWQQSFLTYILAVLLLLVIGLGLDLDDQHMIQSYGRL